MNTYRYCWKPGLWMVLVLMLPGGQAIAQLEDSPEDPTAEPDTWLDESRWSEVQFGLSIRQPLDSLVMLQTPDGARARWFKENGLRISLSIHRGAIAENTEYQHFDHEDNSASGAGTRRAQSPISLNVLAANLTAELEANGSGRTTNLRADKWFQVGERAGYLNYFMIHVHENADRTQPMRPWFYGIGMIQLDQASVVVLRIECPAEEMVEQAICTFECMLQSIETQTIAQATERMHGWVRNFLDLSETLGQEERLAAMRTDQLFRIRQFTSQHDGTFSERDIGYMRMWQRYQAPAYYQQRKAQSLENTNTDRLEGIDSLELTGNALVVQSFYKTQGQAMQIHQLREFIDTEDDITEFWNIKTSVRQPHAAYARLAGDWAETGVRGMTDIRGHDIDRIEIVREGAPPRQLVEYILERDRNPASRLRFPSVLSNSHGDAVPAGEHSTIAWPTPQRAYVSQVDAMLLPALLPREEKTYAFYTYHDETSRIGLRVMRVVPTDDGGKRVFIRPAVQMEEELMEYNAAGELVQWRFPDGRSFVSTTREELARVFGVRLPEDQPTRRNRRRR